MGTDIHSVVQIKINDKWVNLCTEFLGAPRNYTTFGVLAGIRDRAALPISNLKGLPEGFEMDARGYVAQLPAVDFHRDSGSRYWLGDHSFTHYSLFELLQYSLKASAHTYNTLQLTEIPEMINEMGIIAEVFDLGADDIRIVIGFDS